MALRGIGANPLLVEAFGARDKTETKIDSKIDSGAAADRRTA
jgi:hypothetical protein